MKRSGWKLSVPLGLGKTPKEDGKRITVRLGDTLLNEDVKIFGIYWQGNRQILAMLELTSIATGALVSSEPAEGSHS
jgi:hypothetical protein